MSDPKQEKTPAGHSVRRPGLMRLEGMVRKETLQVVRDPSSIAIAFVMPLVLLFIFGYGVSLNAENVPLGIVADDQTARSASLTGAFSSSRFFNVTRFSDIREAEEAMRRGKIDAVVWLRSEFSARVLSGDTGAIGVFISGVDANTARIIQGYVQGVWRSWLNDFAEIQGKALSVPVEIEHRIWFNPAVRSRNFLVPGLIAVIMTLIGALLTALIIAREWERGTMESLMVTPIRVREILLGKIIPYFFLGMGGLLLSVSLALWLFDVPLVGGFWVLMAGSALFLLAALGMGLLISTVAKNQFVAGQAAIITTFLPAFILSGFIFDISSMPSPIQAITYIIAARYYVSIIQTVFSAGNIWGVILPNALALAGMALLFFLLVRRNTRKRLE